MDAQRPIFVGLGEVLWDVFGPDNRRPGGAPANVAFHANQLGMRGVICSRVGTDPLGDELVEYFDGRGVSTEFIQRDGERPTGTVSVDASRPEHPTYVIHEGVAWDAIAFTPELERLLAGASAVCFGTLAQRSAPSRETIRRALESASGALRVYDVNLRPPHVDRDWIEASLGHADVLKLNEDEVGTLGRLLDADAAPARFADQMRERYGTATTCVTRGARGCLALADGAQHEIPGIRVEIADAVGAGDAFTASLASALVWGWPVASAAGLANEVGAVVASRPGAMPDLRSELAKLRARYAPPGGAD